MKEIGSDLQRIGVDGIKFGLIGLLVIENNLTWQNTTFILLFFGTIYIVGLQTSQPIKEKDQC